MVKVSGYKKGVTPTKTIRGESKRRGCTAIHKHLLYDRWAKMMHRCYNPRHNRYKYYGAKGIGVIERWHNFWNYVDDMLPILPPEKSSKRKDRWTMSRIDHAGDYCPDNVRWELPATHYSKHKRKAKLLAGHYIEPKKAA